MPHNRFEILVLLHVIFTGLVLKLRMCDEEISPAALPEGYPAVFSKLFIIVPACCKVMTMDNLSYCNCHAEYFGFMSSDALNYYDSGAGYRMVGCRRLQMVQFYVYMCVCVYIYTHTHTHTHKLHRFVFSALRCMPCMVRSAGPHVPVMLLFGVCNDT